MTIVYMLSNEKVIRLPSQFELVFQTNTEIIWLNFQKLYSCFRTPSAFFPLVLPTQGWDGDVHISFCLCLCCVPINSSYCFTLSPSPRAGIAMSTFNLPVLICYYRTFIWSILV